MQREGRSMTNAPKTVLAIHDLPGFGRAALSVIVPVLSCLGVQAVALPTAVLSTHTGCPARPCGWKALLLVRQRPVPPAPKAQAQ